MASYVPDRRTEFAEGSPRFVEATQKSIAVLRHLKAEGPTSLTDLATELGLSKSTVHRHVSTLSREGFITETDAGYRIGLTFLDYGIQAQQAHDLYTAAKPKADSLAEDIGEKVWCMTEENGLGVFIYHCQATDVFRTYTRVGYRGHLHAFAAGKAVLAHLPEDRIDQIISRHGLPAYSPQTTTDREALLDDLQQVRERGVAYNRQESIKGVNAIGAPIITSPGNPVGSISIAGPANRMQGAYFEEDLPARLLGVANEIEVQLEYR